MERIVSFNKNFLSLENRKARHLGFVVIIILGGQMDAWNKQLFSLESFFHK